MPFECVGTRRAAGGGAMMGAGVALLLGTAAAGRHGWLGGGGGNHGHAVMVRVTPLGGEIAIPHRHGLCHRIIRETRYWFGDITSIIRLPVSHNAAPKHD